MKLGVFDSGKGVAAMADRLAQLLPSAEILSVDDSRHVPYGTRQAQEITTLTDAAIQPLLAADCDAIIIACNTATTTALSALRSTYPGQVFIGIEPMVKPAAAMTQSNTIAVLATPATLSSQRYDELKREWAGGVTVLEPNCTNWAALIEQDDIASIPIRQTVEMAIAKGADVIVLACTHYHLIKEVVQQAAGPSVSVLEPSDAIAQRIQTLLKQS